MFFQVFFPGDEYVRNIDDVTWVVVELKVLWQRLKKQCVALRRAQQKHAARLLNTELRKRRARVARSAYDFHSIRYLKSANPESDPLK